jgi:polysaccharide biosynthesis/export protein
MTSCVPYKDLVLYRKTETPLPDISPVSVAKSIDLNIQPNDALSITVSCIEPQLAVPFNLIDTRSGGQLQANSPFASFLVDNNGDINFPVLGKMQVAKHTIPQLRDTLIKKLKIYMKDPSVNIRRVNFRISVLGEVGKPGSFDINSERVTLLEALALAGDMTPYSDRQRVLVVREENGKITSMKVDLQTPDFYSSPFYFLHQNDVVIVDPKKSKRGSVNDPANKYVSWGSAGLSAITAILTVIALFKR